MGKALLAGGLIGVYGLGVASALDPLDSWSAGALGLVAIASSVAVGLGIFRLTKGVMLLGLSILAGMFAATTVASVVPALALAEFGERVTCQVVESGVKGFKGAVFEYVVVCPDGTPAVVRTSAYARELERAIPNGQPLQVIRDASGWWRPDTDQSNAVVRESLPRWLGVLALPVVLLYPVAFPTVRRAASACH
ncbi:hypothetical protein [Tenggerimyces flavus]|uniref:DUF3592 domain-containing protein n=1 Tax=Tenggerimyces flavus TaxID=1708749 RepID=A0ABV7YEV8_9ACTN|nr:hypothetical protein [Tenggerimyces flavus]MBM7789273.1 hypothetical protein [Tenggerimyces flavus]